MRHTSGVCKINGVQVMSLEVTLQQLPTLNATYALCRGEKNLATGNYVSQETHGRCTAYQTNWSPRTLELLGELIHSMEEDLLPVHFDVGTMEDKNERLAIGGHQETPQF